MHRHGLRHRVGVSSFQLSRRLLNITSLILCPTGHANTVLCSHHTTFFKICWNQLGQENSRTIYGSEKPGKLWFWEKKNSEKAMGLSTFHWGLFPNAWSASWLSISCQLATGSQTIVVAASHSSLCYLPNYHLMWSLHLFPRGEK